MYVSISFLNASSRQDILTYTEYLVHLYSYNSGKSIVCTRITLSLFEKARSRYCMPSSRAAGDAEHRDREW